MKLAIGRIRKRSKSNGRRVAIALFLAATLAMSVQSATTSFDAAHAAQSRGDYQTAIRLYSDALASDRLAPADRARAHVNRGNAHAVAGALQAAAADFDAAVRLDPNDVNALVNRGTMAFLLGHRSAAFLDFTKAQQIAPRDAYISLWLEMSRLRINKPDAGVLRATAELREAGKWPHPIVAVFLGQAEPDSLELYTGEPTKPQGRSKRCEAAFFLGEIYLHREQRAAARDWLTKAMLWCPHSFIEFIAARAELHTQQLPVAAARDAVTPPEPVAALERRYVTTTRVNARSGPGTEHRRVKVLASGTRLDVDGIEGGWYRVAGLGPAPVFVHGDYVAADAARPDPPVPRRADAANDAQSPRYVTSANVNLRVGPGIGFRRVKLLPKGTPLAVDGIEQGWYRVLELGPSPGYVHGDFVARQAR